MGEQEKLEIQNLTDDDLLTVYDMVVEHIQYLQGSIIDTTVVEEESETDENEGETEDESEETLDE